MIFGATSETTAQVVRVKPHRPAKVLAKPAKAKRGHVWIAGHHQWNTRSRKYVWTQGRWAKARRGHAWAPGQWVAVKGKGHKWVPGHWKKRR